MPASLLSQDKNQERQIILQLGLSDFGSFLDYQTIRGIYNINLHYRFSNYFGAGAQFGYGQFQQNNYLTGENVFVGHIYRYSASGRFHLTPFFAKNEYSRFDLYISGIIGGQSSMLNELYSYPGTYNSIDYGAYFGAKYNPIKQVGIYCEAGLGKHSYSQFGILFSF